MAAWFAPPPREPPWPSGCETFRPSFASSPCPALFRRNRDAGAWCLGSHLMCVSGCGNEEWPSQFNNLASGPLRVDGRSHCCGHASTLSRGHVDFLPANVLPVCPAVKGHRRTSRNAKAPTGGALRGVGRSSANRRGLISGGKGGIRTLVTGEPVNRISSPAHSTTLPPFLRVVSLARRAAF